MNSSVHGINLFDFHATPLAIPFIFLTAYFLEKAQYSKALITSTFILMTKEDAGIALISLGMFYMLKDYTDDTFSRIYNLLKRALRFNLTQLEKVSIWLILLGSTWSLLSLKVIVPYFAKGPHYTFTHYYTGSCINYLPHKVAYFLLINLTLGMLPFVLNFRYWFLLSFIPWVEILASCQINMFRIGFQYPYMLIPLSYIALSYGIKDLIMNNLPLRFKKIVYMGLTVGIIFSIMTTPALPPLIDTFNTPLIFRGSYEPITPHHKILSEIVNTLNNCSCSILTQNDIFPHLANRNNT
ncbi:TPA: DUF2079 domain-containing protein [Candidatus Micrarchaeota archaeon]|nr:DUF2079 domain-containing protein [Candidatus Micrarchaeota archaeon]